MRRLVICCAASFLALTMAPAWAAWLSGGTSISPTPALDESFDFSPDAICPDGADGFLVGFTSQIWHPGVGYEDSHLLATRITDAGDLSPGWPVDLATWNPDDPNATYYEGRSIVPDGSGGAHLLTRMAGVVAGEWLERMRRFHVAADGSFTAIPADPFEALLVVDHKAVADGAGGVVIAGIQVTTAPPLETPPPAHLFVRREDAAGTPLWTPSPGAPGVALALASDVAHGGGLDALQVLGDDSGGCWVTHLGSVAGNYDLRMDRVLGDGSLAPGWPAGGMRPASATDYEVESRLARGPDGSVYLAWNDGRQTLQGGWQQVWLSRIEADGTLSAGWPDGGVRLGTGTSEHGLVALAADGAGGVFAVRSRTVGPPDTPYGWVLYLHHVGPDGLPSSGWTTDGILLTAGWAGTRQAALVDDGLGGAFVAYVDADGLHAKRFKSDGTAGDGLPADGVLLSATGLLPAIARSGSDAIVAWEAAPEGTASYQLYAQRLLQSNVAGVPGGAAELRFGLERIEPNPARGASRVVIALRRAGSARLEVIDVAGRRVVDRTCAGLSTGRQELALPETARLGPGVYVVRLTSGGETASARMAITR